MTSLETARMLLIPFDVSDEDALLGLFQTAAVRRFLLDDQIVPRDWVRTEIRASQERFGAGELGLWTITLPPVRTALGFVGFRPFFDPPELQLLYGLLPDHWGAGLATEAAAAVCRHAFERLDFDEIRAATDVPNHASERVLDRLGFELARTTTDGAAGTRFFVLTRERFRRQQEGHAS